MELHHLENNLSSNREIKQSEKIDYLLTQAFHEGLLDEINMGPDTEGRMNASAAILLKELNDLGWKADWQK